MSRIYEYNESPYYGGNSISSIDEYLDRINRMHRMPTMIEESPQPQTPPRPHHNNSVHQEKHHQYHEAPQLHRKVHFTEHEKHVEIDRHHNHEVYEERTIDMEADGFIQKRHKSFDSCTTFKGR
ncbi:hypothetical protein C2S51_020605 [Perilla frutescens var. frutescens]|nr:hypothetical protein C2S51_020605 [Perilla frutescens var. frutescens]